MKQCIVLGIVGGVASGKSEVTRRLQARGAHVIHADTIGHEVLREKEIRDRLVDYFGTQILSQETGEIERPRFAQLVFGNDTIATENRRYLESVVHPRIRTRIAELLDSLQQTIAPNERPLIVVLDVPLLIESGWYQRCDRILFIETAEELRHQRALARGWTSNDFRDREAAQLPIEQKRRFATDIIDNNGPLQLLDQRIEQFMNTLITP
ncbi:MAG: dephospho-CoA kinase [Planctomycetes bacterium]|nr:dephospho-CoA kinase [Planctomycetota bacterium]